MKQTHAYCAFDLISAPVFVLEINADGAPVYAAFNDYARKLSGRPLSDYLGRTAMEVYPQAFGRTAYARHCEVRDSGVPMTYQLDLPIGNVARTVRTTLRPECDASGKVVRLYGTSIDITIEKNALEAKVQFDTMSSEMEQFVALAAHDLRSPMRNIALIADMLRVDFIDCGDGKLELLDTLETIAVKTSALINDVLSHVETVAVGANDTAFSFPSLCYSITDTLDPAGRHSVACARATVRTDRTALQIALRNLMENTLKRGGGRPLELGIDVSKGAKGMIDVTLTDNGPGFAPDALNVLNQAQFRAETGHGLIGVKRLIFARGGSLIARNLPDGMGAMVRFSLPGSYINGSGSLGDAERLRRMIPGARAVALQSSA